MNIPVFLQLIVAVKCPVVLLIRIILSSMFVIQCGILAFEVFSVYFLLKSLRYSFVVTAAVYNRTFISKYFGISI